MLVTGPGTPRQERSVRSHQLTVGRTFGVAFDHGEDFFAALTEFCHTNQVRQGFIPGFIAGLSEVDLVGTCDRLDDPAAPVWSPDSTDINGRSGLPLVWLTLGVGGSQAASAAT
jgi:hypothetical protein